jgi:hypothetical protein
MQHYFMSNILNHVMMIGTFAPKVEIFG